MYILYNIDVSKKLYGEPKWKNSDSDDEVLVIKFFKSLTQIRLVLQAAQDAFRSVVVITMDTEVPTAGNAVVMNELKQRSKSDYNYPYQNDETVRSRLSQNYDPLRKSWCF